MNRLVQWGVSGNGTAIDVLKEVTTTDVCVGCNPKDVFKESTRQHCNWCCGSVAAVDTLKYKIIGRLGLVKSMVVS